MQEKPLHRSHPNLPTIKKIQDLAEYREHNWDKWNRPPSWTRACRTVGIHPTTVKRHAPELLEKWDDPNFHWQS